MKNTKRTLMCMLCMLLITVSFTSCKEEKPTFQQGEVQKVQNEKKKEVQSAANRFMDALCKMDASSMATMCLDSEALKRRFPFEDFKAYVEELNTADLTEEDSSKKVHYIMPAVNSYADKLIQGISYVTKNPVITDGGYEVLVTVEMYNPGDVSGKARTIMKEDILEKKGSDISKKILSDGTINDDSTEEEIVSALYKGASGEVIPMIESAVTSSKKVKEDYVVYIVEKEGKLLVDTTRSTAVFAICPEVFKIN